MSRPTRPRRDFVPSYMRQVRTLAVVWRSQAPHKHYNELLLHRPRPAPTCGSEYTVEGGDSVHCFVHILGSGWALVAVLEDSGRSDPCSTPMQAPFIPAMLLRIPR